MHTFGMPRVHRILLCIRFPHVMGFLTLTLREVETRSAPTTTNSKYDFPLLPNNEEARPSASRISAVYALNPDRIEIPNKLQFGIFRVSRKRVQKGP